MKIRLILFILLFSIPLSAQYRSGDRELIKMNFLRKADNSLLDKYLSSGSPDKIRAALLSISHLGDTSKAEKAVKADYKVYGDYMAFTLGQLGQSAYSTRFLMDKLNSASNPFQRECFEAIGKTGSLSDLEHLIKNAIEKPRYNIDGLPLAIANFSFRGIRLKDSSEIKFLTGLIGNSKASQKKKTEALYALYRLGGSNRANSSIISILSAKDNGNDEAVTLKQYALSALRRTKFFPQERKLLASLLNHKSWIIRTEASRAACYFTYSREKDLDAYFALMHDKNPNVSRQAAISLKELRCDSILRPSLRNRIEKLLEDTTLTINCRGELFLSLSSFYPDKLYDFTEKYRNKIAHSFIIRGIAENSLFPERNFQYLLQMTDTENPSDRIEVWTALMAVSGKISDRKTVSREILKGFYSTDPAVLTIVASEADSLFISENRDELLLLIPRIANRFIHLPDYQESITAMAGLAKRVDRSLYSKLIDIIGGSDVTALRKFALREAGINDDILKDTTQFQNIWSNSFKYKYAVVTTNKGSFTFEFFPQAAPLSVGSFCYLAQTAVFRNSLFHRVVPDFVIQTGDPYSTGWGGPGYSIISEYSPIPFEKGHVGMASSGKDTEGSQWFVMHGSFPHLNTRYSNFGRITEGMDVVNLIDQGDIVLKVELK